MKSKAVLWRSTSMPPTSPRKARASSTSATTPITKAIRGALARELVALGVATREALRARGWKTVFAALIARHPRRRTTSTALSLCAAEMGIRPMDVSERRLGEIETFVLVQHVAAEAAATKRPAAELIVEQNEAMNRQARRIMIAAGRATPIAGAVRAELAAALVGLDVRTVGELRRRGWRRVFAELVAREPRRRTKATATAIYAADAGLRPSDVRSVPGAEAEIARACMQAT
jgi:hypothetical protein